MGLTTRQTEVLNFIRSFAVDGVSKISLGQIAKHFGLKGGPSQVQHTMNALIIKGYLVKIAPVAMQEGNSYKILKTK